MFLPHLIFRLITGEYVLIFKRIVEMSRVVVEEE